MVSAHWFIVTDVMLPRIRLSEEATCQLEETAHCPPEKRSLGKETHKQTAV